MIFLDNIDKDKEVYREGRYWVKQYAYHAFNYIGTDGKPIKERVFSFILYLGKVWDNSTNRNFKESELHTVIGTYKGILNGVREKRRELLTTERKERKLYPQRINWIFTNVTITAVVKMGYHGDYPAIGQKSVSLYANGMSYSYLEGKLYDKDFELTTDWLFGHISTAKVRQYNSYKLKNSIPTKVYHFDKPFAPYHFYIGYVIKHKGTEYIVKNIYDDGFETNKGKLPMSLQDLQNMEVLGEIQGIAALPCLIAKMNYV